MVVAACLAMPHQALLIALPIAVFFDIAFIVLLFAFGEANLAFGAALFPVQGERDGGIAFALNGPQQVGDFLCVQQELAGALGFGMDVGGGGVEGVDECTEQKSLAVFQQHVAVTQLHFASTQAFDLPTFEYNTRLKPLLDKKVMFGFFIQGDRAALCLFFVGFGHECG